MRRRAIDSVPFSLLATGKACHSWSALRLLHELTGGNLLRSPARNDGQAFTQPLTHARQRETISLMVRLGQVSAFAALAIATAMQQNAMRTSLFSTGAVVPSLFAQYLSPAVLASTSPNHADRRNDLLGVLKIDHARYRHAENELVSWRWTIALFLDCCDLAGALHGLRARLQQQVLQRGCNHKKQNQQTEGIHCADPAPVGGLDFLENPLGFLIQIKMSAN